MKTEVCNKKVRNGEDCNDEWDAILDRMVNVGEVYTAVRSRKNIVIRNGVEEFLSGEYFLLEIKRWVSMEGVMKMDKWRDEQINKII
jgi:hypothetical protein